MAAEISVEEKLKQLFNLQQIDSKLAEIEILKGELPMEVSDLEDDIAGLDTRKNRLEGQVSGLEEEVNRHRANISEAENLILRYQKQMDEVKNNREYDALTKEIELQKLEIQLSEKKIRQAEKDIQKKQETLSATIERVEAKQKDLETKKVELEKIIEKTEKDEEKLKKQSAKANKKIDDRLLKAYSRVRTSYRNGLAVVSVERNACGGCFNQIPPQLQVEIAQHKKIIVCEHCGRILINENTLLAAKEEATA